MEISLISLRPSKNKKTTLQSLTSNLKTIHTIAGSLRYELKWFKSIRFYFIFYFLIGHHRMHKMQIKQHVEFQERVGT